MIITTIRITVYGDSHEEIQDKINRDLAAYLQVALEELSTLIPSCEIQVGKYEEPDAEFDYKADVIARVK